ncbi:autotransporter domain-containing protein [Stenotrophomonas maltophilia]|uniref:autotransporter domain-containing protein n=1 Tax=Stenotrophomonas maltophilia TaxID=40324 RepID=UPI0007EF6935|nr:autotransporter serine protease [Stenotrophomonas maltophilia]OBU51733.1 autotransporter outer membrane beta-barrel domain-containing protein [Stenotrophomonas maltophilia]
MNHPLHGRSSRSRSPLQRPLALAVASSLLLAAALPAMASDSLDAWQQQRQLQAAWAQPGHAQTDATVGASAQATSTPVLGNAGDAASWHSDEFNADWGLAAMGADHAYARGLTGQGVRLALFDSGSALAHPEFAGRNTTSITIGPDCATAGIVAGEGACSQTRGEQPGYNYYGLGAGVPAALAGRLIAAGLPYGFSYADHGTHVLGTIGANRDGTGMHGVAFGADLTAARVFGDTYYEWRLDPDGFYRPRAVYRTDPDDDAVLDMYAQVQAQGVRAINHSWGISTRNMSAAALDRQYAAIGADYDVYGSIYAGSDAAPGSTLIQVWSAGNGSGAVAGITAALPRWKPEIEPYWLAVANVRQPVADDGETDYVLDDSSSICGAAANWCISAPGTDIASTIVSGEIQGRIEETSEYLRLIIDSENTEYTYGLKTGTSMAAPHITGALGLLFERFPYLDSAQVRDVLLTTARDLGDPGIDEIYGWGMVDLRKAIEGFGSLRVDTDVVMNQKAGGLKVWEGEAWDDWTNDIGGPGKLTKSGIGWLRLSGDNSFNGAVVNDGVLELNGANTLTSAVEVKGGQFLLNGSLVSTALNTTGGVSTVSAGGVLDHSNLVVDGGVISFNGTQTGGNTTVGANGLLKGVGTLGTTRVDGIIAPGNSIGTLTVNGDYVQGATGVFASELAPGGRSDQLHVTGTATLDGTLVALPEPGVYYLGEQFNILRADGGISGQFARTDFSAFSPFLQFSLAYSANGARIDVARGALLATAATTRNQRAVAGVADGLAINQGLPRPLTQLFPAQVGAALDGLSGELHAATPLVLVESSRYVRDAALSRRAGNASPGSTGDATGAWVQAIGGNGKLDGDVETARTDANSNGLLVGIDREFDGWQAGVLAGTGRTDVKQRDRRAKSKIDNTHVGAYASHSWGGFGLRGGVAWSKHEAESTRELAFAGFSDTLTGRYDARTRQAFLEAGYRFGSDEGGLEPYLQVARVEVDLKRINERGGAAALQGEVKDTRTTVATAGLRFDKGLKASFQQDSWLHLRGAVGYRRASGDRSQVANLAFANGGGAFAVSGAPIADSAVVAELGLSAWLTPRQSLELGYSGQFGSESRDHGATARWSVRF